MDNYTERLADGVWRIEVAPYTNAFLVAADGGSDAEGLTLVDAGVSRSGPRLVRSIRLLGFDPRSVRGLVLTHWHRDHMGAAARFMSSSAATAVYAGRRELPAVTGEQRLPYKAAQRHDLSWLGRRVGRLMAPGPPVTGAQALDDGDTVPSAPRAVVVDSPGHTLGHISVHIPDAGVLIAGDAVWNVLTVSRGFGFTRSARSHDAATLERLSRLPFEILAPGHGPPVVKDGQRRLAALAQRAGSRPPAAA